jgi:HSP20 family protein
MARVDKNRNKREPARKTIQPNQEADFGFKLGGVLGKLGGLLEKVSELAEAGESFSRSGEIKGLDTGGKVRGVYGFSIRSGLGDQGEQELKIEPFGNIHSQPGGEPAVEETREPLVDVHEEDDHVLVLAEIPGVSKKDVQLHLSGNRLNLSAQRGEKRYGKEVILPGEFTEAQMRWECSNGILKIRLER